MIQRVVFIFLYGVSSMFRLLPSGSVNKYKLSFKVSFFDSFLFHVNDPWRLNTD